MLKIPTIVDIIDINIDPQVSIGSIVLMVKAQRVQELVLDIPTEETASVQ